MLNHVTVRSSWVCSELERRIQALDDRMNNIQNTLRETMSRLNDSPQLPFEDLPS